MAAPPTILYRNYSNDDTVSIYYNNNKVSSMSDSGTRTLTTSGKYCEGNITVKYVKPNEENDMIFLTATGTSDTTLTLNDNAITTVPLTTQVTGNASDALSIAENGIKILKDGNYLVCGSIYYQVAQAATVPVGEGVYIFVDSTEQNSTIIFQANNISSAVGITPKILSISANSTVFLKARNRLTDNNGKLVVDNDNVATYLCVVKV